MISTLEDLASALEFVAVSTSRNGITYNYDDSLVIEIKGGKKHIYFHVFIRSVFNGDITCVCGDDDVKGFPLEYTFNPVDIGDVNPELGDTLVKEGLNYIRKNYLVLSDFLANCKLVRDNVNCPTAYITYNEVLDLYEIHYNTEFILKKAIEIASFSKNVRSDSVKDRKDAMTRFAAFIFLHEVSHALKYHMIRQQSSVSGLSHEVINIVGDSAINVALQKNLMLPLIPGIVNETVVYSGRLKRKMNFLDLIQEVKDLFSSLRGDVKISGDARGVWSDTEDVSIVITCGAGFLSSVFQGNTNLYITRVASFVGRLLSVDDATSGGDSAKSGDGTMNGGSSGTSSTASSAQKSQSSSSSSPSSSSSFSSSSSSSSSGDSSDIGQDNSGGQDSSEEPQFDKKSRKDSSLGSKAAKDAIQKAVEDAIDRNQNADDPSGGSGGDSGGDLLSNFGGEGLARNMKNLASWKGKLRRLLQEALSSTERYASEMPNARIEGQFGREVDVSVPKRIILAIDCSGSMGPQTFLKCLREIQVFLVALPFKNLEVDVIYWGSKTKDIRIKRVTNTLVTKIKSEYIRCGGTNFDLPLMLIKKKYKKFDLCIVFTDGGFGAESSSKDAIAFARKNKQRLLWVFTPKYSLDGPKGYDPAVKRKSIVMH